jgi:hypothetical protein
MQTLFVGERRYGHLGGRSQARLVGHAGRALYLGRRQAGRRKPMRPEAWWLDPALRIGIGETLYAVAPWRLTEAPPLRKTEKQVYAELKKRLRGRPYPLQAGQITWLADRAWLATDGGQAGMRLASIDRITEKTTTAIQPFESRRVQLGWGAIAHDGRALVANETRLFSIDRAGQLADVAPRPAIDPPAAGRAVRIGKSWWAITADAGSRSLRSVTRLVPTAASARGLARLAYRNASALVGGAAHGLFIALDHGRLRVFRLSADGKTKRLGSYRSTVGRGFDAVSNGAGGAVVVGRARNAARHAIAFSIDARGRVLASHRLPLQSLQDDGWTLQAQPGGALLRQGGIHIWLDARGRVLARKQTSPALGDANSQRPCARGNPATTRIASPSPGQFVSLPQAATRGCWISPPRWTHTGELTLLRIVENGLDSSAELLTIGPWPARTSSAPPSAVAIRPAPQRLPKRRCPADMIDVAGRFCIDRFEGRLFGGEPLRALSPFYSPSQRHTDRAWSVWNTRRLRVGDLHARASLLPARPPPQPHKTLARSLRGVLPSGYLTSYAAEKSCQAVGKRLCEHSEWRTACRGEDDTKFPYGDEYRHGTCNVFREVHPAGALHGNSSIGHLDPRLHLVRDRSGTLLRPTGSLAACASRWGQDAVYDMVGNLDEWVDQKSGAFAGGFYARASRSGCESIIAVHPRRYFDYSLGTRCCRAVAR